LDWENIDWKRVERINMNDSRVSKVYLKLELIMKELFKRYVFKEKEVGMKFVLQEE
jgi:hypothetical protein